MISFAEYVKNLESMEKSNKLLERKIAYRKVAIRKELVERAGAASYREFEAVCANDSVLIRLEYEKSNIAKAAKFLYENAELQPKESEVTSVD